jgi:hypothetical protein
MIDECDLYQVPPPPQKKKSDEGGLSVKQLVSTKFLITVLISRAGVTKRCRLSWMTNIAPSYMSPNAGGEGKLRGLSSAHGAQKNFGDLTPYLITMLITYQGPFYRTPVNDCLLFDTYSVLPGSFPLAPLYRRLCGRRPNYRRRPGQAAQMEVPQGCNNMHF